MNRSLHRLIFNAARGQIMAVAEVAASHTGSGSTGESPRQQRCAHRQGGATGVATPGSARIILRKSLLSLCALLTALPPGHMARAQVIADPNAAATLRPQILNSANGTTQVNIQTPSAAGVSRNVYQQFDVHSQGVILNNATSAVQTQIGGWVQANGNLAGNSARVILNEVNASTPSQLRGFVEVAGQRAEVVIANPAGIAVNGGGFINASTVTLTTGTPILNSGNLEGYRVTGGSIQIEGAGLDVSGGAYAQVLARAVQLNAGLWAQQVKVVTGAHQANADASVITSVTPDAGSAPTYSLDVAALGGMYAGKITLIGTEAGLGVNNAGVLAADSELVLRADGQLVNRGVLDAQATRITAGDLQNLGTGRIYGDHMVIQATTLNNAPETINGVTTAPVIAARERLDIAVGTMVNGLDALLLSGGDLAIGSTLDAQQRASGSAQSILNAGGIIEAVGHLHASADSIRNTNPGFAYEIRSDGSFNGKEYITSSGIYTTEQVAWVLAENTFGGAGPGGGYRYSSGQGRFLPAGHAYAETKYQPYYNSANAYVAAHTTYNTDYEGNSYPVPVPDSFAYSAGDPIWGVFGITPPTGQAPGNRPTTTVGECHDGGGCSYNVPTAAEIAAWDAAAAPWLTLQSRLDSFRASVNASAITFTAFRNFSQDIPVAVVTASTPGQILSGGNMTLHAGTELVNDQSRIMAGGALAVTGQSLENRGLDVAATAERTGRSYAWSNFNHGCGNIKGCDYNYNAYRDSAYNVGIPQTLSLNSARTDAGSAPDTAGLGASASLPTSSLFHTAPDPQAHYLIETDPLFTSYRNWLSSDYMLQHLGVDPALTQKRLGDGYYEQRLVREQVAQLTGRRFLGEYTSDEQQYQALMNAGVAYAQAHDLRPGIALSAEQMAALTTDLVWLVAQTVTLPDGSTTTALVPRLYTVARDGDLDGNGALLSARNLDVQLDGQFSSSGRIAAVENARIKAHDIQLASSGATDLQANRITLQATQDIQLVGSRVEAGSSLDIQAGRDLNLTTTTASGSSADGQHSVTQIDRVASLSVKNAEGTLLAAAGRDLALTGAVVESAGATSLQAGNDITLHAVQTAASYNFSGGNATHQDSTRSDVGSLLSAGTDLNLQAGADIKATAAQLQSGEQLQVDAGRDLLLQAGRSESSYSHSLEVSTSSLFSTTTTRTQVDTAQTHTIASSLEGKTVSLSSGRDTAITASDVTAEQALQLSAGRDVNVLAGEDMEASRSVSQTIRSASGLAKALGNSLAFADPVGTIAPGTGTQITVATLLTREQQKDDTVQRITTVRSSNLSGGTVQIESGRDTTLQAAQVVADGQVSLQAAGDVKLLAAEQTSQSKQHSATDKSGLLSQKLLSTSVGKSEQDYKEQNNSSTSVVTQIASLGQDSQGQVITSANVQIQAQGSVSGEGAQLLAPTGDITVKASSVALLEARNEVSMASQQSSKTTAVTSQVGSSLVSAVQNIDRAAELRSQAKESGDKRTQMLADLNVAMAAYNAYGTATGGGGNPDTPTPQAGPTAGFTAGTSIGASQSSSQSQQSQSTGTQGQIVAGGDIRISAVGAGQDSNLTLQGQNVQAGGKVALTADNNVNMLASQDRASQESSNNSSGGAVGVTFSAGGNQNGFSFQLSANKALGQADGDSSTYNNTHVSGDSVRIKSGEDTTLKGAVITAREVSADVGGNLMLESLQDFAVYTDKQSSSGAGVSLCIPPICYGQMAVVNVSVAKAKIDSDYLSVGEQSAIRAGNGGFQVKVGGDTTLTGAQITSTQAAIDDGKNSFTTGGTLTTQDLQNRAEYEASSYSVSISTAGGGAAGYSSDSGSAQSTSTAAISGIAGDTGARTGDAETGIKPIFDAAKVKQDIQLATAVTSEFGRNASKAVGDYATTKLKEAQKNQDKEGIEAWKEGGSTRVALHAVVGGLSLGAQGALGSTAASTAAPLIDQLQAGLQEELVKAGLGQEAAKAIAGLTGAGTAAVIGGAAGGVAGATTALNADVNNRQLHPDEKQRIKELAKGDAQKEARLTAAACALVKCYAEYPEGSDAYNVLKAMADAGSNDAMAAERQQLKAQQGLFSYSKTDQFLDSAKQVNNTYQVTTRTLGAGQALLGGAGIAGSVATAPASCATGLGCFANAAIATLSADAVVAGVKQAINGQPENTYLNQALQGLGLSPEAAGYAEFVLGVSAAAKVTNTLMAPIKLDAAANAWSKGTYTGQSAITHEGRVYRFSDPEYAGQNWEIYPGNVRQNYRYSEPGVGSIYSGTSVQTSAAEVASYREGLNGFTPKALVAGDVRIDNILDLTDAAALRALGVTKAQITQSSHGANGAYTHTQRIAEWAREQGYNGILAPSAQNKSGTNLITFDSTVVTNVKVSPQPSATLPFGRTKP